MKTYKILIIDDEEGIHVNLSGLLKLWGFEPLSAFNAYDGLAIALKEEPLIIILDIGMPEVNGEILLKMLKRIEQTNHIPVLILSGSLDKDILTNTYREGAAKFISKPFLQKILLRRITECLDPDTLEEMNLSKY